MSYFYGDIPVLITKYLDLLTILRCLETSKSFQSHFAWILHGECYDCEQVCTGKICLYCTCITCSKCTFEPFVGNPCCGICGNICDRCGYMVHPSSENFCSNCRKRVCNNCKYNEDFCKDCEFFCTTCHQPIDKEQVEHCYYCEGMLCDEHGCDYIDVTVCESCYDTLRE